MVVGVPMIPGRRTALRENGFVAGICRACRQVGILKVRTVASQRTRNFIAVSDSVTGFEVQCEYCGIRRRVGHDEFSQFLPDASIGLAEMLKQTNPGASRAIAELSRENAALLDGTAGEDDRVTAAALIIEAMLADAEIELGSFAVDVWTALCIPLLLFALLWVLIAWGNRGTPPGFVDWAMLGAAFFVFFRTTMRGGQREFGRLYTAKLSRVLLRWRLNPGEVESALDRLARGLTVPSGWVDRKRLLRALTEAPPSP